MSEIDRPPGKVQAIGILHLIAGIQNVLMAILWIFTSFSVLLATFGLGFLACCIPFIYGGLAIIEIYSGIRHLSSDHTGLRPPMLVGIVEIFGILGCGMISVVSGVLTLVFLQDPEVAAYYQRKQVTVR